MINVAIIGSLPKKYGGGTGGVASHVEQLAIHLAAKKIDVVVYSDIELSTKVNSCFEIIGLKNKKNIFKYFLANPISFMSRLLSRDLLALKRDILTFLIKARHKESKTVIHVHSLHNKLYDDEALSKFPNVVTDHGYWQSNTMKHSDISNRLNHSCKIISVTNYAQSLLRQDFPEVSADKLEVIYNPIDFRESEQRKGKKPYFAFFNGYSDSVSRKGFLDFLLIAESFPSKSFVAIVDEAGKDAYKSSKANNILILEQTNYDKIIQLYSESEFMILPSKSESFGLVYLEAASMQVPVLGFSPVIKEFNEYLGTCIGVPYLSSGKEIDLLQGVQKLTELDFDKVKIARSVRSNFSWHTKVDDFMKIYEDVLYDFQR